MKRALFNNIKAQPYTSGTAIDRDGFLSAVLAVDASDTGKVKVEVTHGDTSAGSFEPVNDPRLFVDCAEEVTAENGDTVVFKIDLVGCKQFVKFAITGDADGCALVLGDAAQAPVEG